MGIQEEICYLDTSAIVKRYVSEAGSEVVDELFKDAYRGMKILSISYWNIAEIAVVFDKYERILGLNAKDLLKNFLSETKILRRLYRLKIIGVSPPLLRETIKLILRYHIYAADALQIASAKTVKSMAFTTGDKKLVSIAEKEGLKTIFTG
jgi:predicted nucleic acid-binding protein